MMGSGHPADDGPPAKGATQFVFLGPAGAREGKKEIHRCRNLEKLPNDI
jgi:hypothetical protein